MTVLLVAVGGAIGAPLRYLIDRRVRLARASSFPWGTLVVNVLGSFVLGFLAGLALFDSEPSMLRFLLGTGVCGALTTFSTFGYETVRLLTEGARLYALANAGLSISAGFGSALTGILIAAAIWG